MLVLGARRVRKLLMVVVLFSSYAWSVPPQKLPSAPQCPHPDSLSEIILGNMGRSLVTVHLVGLDWGIESMESAHKVTLGVDGDLDLAIVPQVEFGSDKDWVYLVDADVDVEIWGLSCHYQVRFPMRRVQADRVWKFSLTRYVEVSTQDISLR